LEKYSKYWNPDVVKAHQLAICLYGTVDRDRAAFIQECVEKDIEDGRCDRATSKQVLY
jgi:hypothetical protein